MISKRFTFSLKEMVINSFLKKKFWKANLKAYRQNKSKKHQKEYQNAFRI